MNLRRPTGDLFGISVISIGNLVSNGIGAIMWLYLASVMQVGDYGEIGFYVSLATVVGTAAALGLDTVLLTYLPKEKERRIFSQSASLAFLVSAVAALAVLQFVGWETSLLVLGVTYFSINTAEVLGSMRYKEYAMVVIMERAARLALSIAFFFVFGPMGILLGFAVSHIALSVRFLHSLQGFSLQFGAIRAKFRFSAYSLGWNILQILPTILDKALIIALFGATTLGLYQLGAQFISMAGILPSSIYQFLLPKKSAGMISRKVLLLAIFLSVGMAAAFVILSPIIIDALFQNYTDAKQLVQLTGVAIVPLTITSIMNSILQAKEKASVTFAGGVLYIAVLLAGIVAFGTSWGINGLGVAFLFAQSLQAIFAVLAVRLLPDVEA